MGSALDSTSPWTALSHQCAICQKPLVYHRWDNVRVLRSTHQDYSARCLLLSYSSDTPIPVQKAVETIREVRRGAINKPQVSPAVLATVQLSDCALPPGGLSQELREKIQKVLMCLHVDAIEAILLDSNSFFSQYFKLISEAVAIPSVTSTGRQVSCCSSQCSAASANYTSRDHVKI